jgi:YidC/Oxa1 family membrane protein insertase
MSNEQRFILFIALSIVVMVGYAKLFPQKQPALLPAAQATAQALRSAASKNAAAPVNAVMPQAESIRTVPGAFSNIPEKKYTLENNLMAITFSSTGAVMTSCLLKNYSDSDVNTKQASLELIPSSSSYSYMSLSSPGLKLDSGSWAFGGIKGSSGKKTVSFTMNAGRGLMVSREFTMEDSSYIVNLSVKLKNTSGAAAAVRNMQLLWGPNIHILPEDMAKSKDSFNRYQKIDYPLDGDNVKAYQVNLKAKENKISIVPGLPRWLVIRDLHFMSSFMLPDTDRVKNLFYRENAGGFAYIGVNLNDTVLPPGASDEIKIDSYIGPQEYKRLAKLKMQGIVELGWIRILGVGMFYAMDFLYRLTKNYGIAILLLTLLVRLILWIPSQNSYKQMKETQSKMKIINPRMETLKKIYKDDPAKLNEETMKLYKEYKINPMGGCLPMLIQVPIFIALYQTLISMVELKGAYFFGWLRDLSRPDPFFILPVFMGVTMIIQSKMSSQVSVSPEAETQQKMMMWGMPLFLTFMALKWPAGLLLYWSMSNILAIAQQFFVNKTK